MDGRGIAVELHVGCIANFLTTWKQLGNILWSRAEAWGKEDAVGECSFT